MQLQSDQIKVFPTSRRDDSKDRNARLNTEQNLISIVNRLTSVDSFVIEGLNVVTQSSVPVISSGSCNIHGYYFEILDDIIVDTSSDPKPNDFLCFRIATSSTPISNSSATGENGLLVFEELEGYDSKNTYSGLTIDSFSENDMKEATSSYFLPLAKFDGSTWVELANKNLKYIAQDLQVNVPNNLSTLDVNQTNLQNFLQHFIIDDGELTD